MKKSIYIVFLIAAAVLMMNGCTTSEFNSVQAAIEDQVSPASVENILNWA